MEGLIAATRMMCAEKCEIRTYCERMGMVVPSKDLLSISSGARL